MPDAPDNVSTNTDGYCKVQVAGLRVGTKLQMPITDERDVLLLAENQMITAAFLENLGNRAISHIKVHKDELPRIYAGEPQGSSREVPPSHPTQPVAARNDFTDALDEELRRPGNCGLTAQGDAFASEVQQHGVVSYNEDMRQAVIEQQNQSVTRMGGVFTNLIQGGGLDVEGLSAIADDAMQTLSADSDLFACLGINPFSGDYPSRHSVHVCMLALSIGTQLNLDRPTLKELSIGCLIHDAGMLLINRSVYQRSSRLDRIGFLEITKHPVRIFDKMKEMRLIPSRSAYIAYQIHERNNGSGYPRQRSAEQIHFLSKVAAVADSYVALVSPRPYRPAILPHMAIQTIILGTNNGHFDSASVNALLRTVSSFPIGSFVELSDGRVGRVIRSNGVEFDSPIVEVWNRDNLQKKAAMVDLLQESELFIRGPLSRLNAPLENEATGISEGESGQRPSGHSPSVAAVRSNATGESFREERTHARRSFQTSVTLYTRGVSLGGRVSWKPQTAESFDISSGGMCLITPASFNDESVLVAFSLKAEARVCIHAQVTRSRVLPSGFREYGLKFKELAVEPAETGIAIG